MLTHTASIVFFFLFLHFTLCNGCMPVRAVCKPHSPDLKKRCCNLWHSLIERPPPARNPGFETRSEQEGGVDLGGGVTDIFFKDGVSRSSSHET